MTICYHGTPITPKSQLYRMAGQSFCVSFAESRDADFCQQFGQSVLWDNGAFSAYTRGQDVDERALYEWLESRLYHPHRAVVLDRIAKPEDADGADVAAQRAMVKRWPFPRDLSWPVWHLDKPLSYLDELIDGGWSGVCLGSAGLYWEIGSTSWERRMDGVFEHLSRNGRLPWLHGLRMLGQVGAWPLASADSTNVAQNFGRDTGCAHCKAKQVNSVKRRRPSAPGQGMLLEDVDAR